MKKFGLLSLRCSIGASVDEARVLLVRVFGHTMIRVHSGDVDHHFERRLGPSLYRGGRISVAYKHRESGELLKCEYHIAEGTVRIECHFGQHVESQDEEVFRQFALQTTSVLSTQQEQELVSA